MATIKEITYQCDVCKRTSKSKDFNTGNQSGGAKLTLVGHEGGRVRYEDLQAYIGQIKADAVREAVEYTASKWQTASHYKVVEYIRLIEDYADKLQRGDL